MHKCMYAKPKIASLFKYKMHAYTYAIMLKFRGKSVAKGVPLHIYMCTACILYYSVWYIQENVCGACELSTFSRMQKSTNF